MYLLGPLDGRVKTSPFYLLGVFSLGGLPGGGKVRLVFLRSISVLASDLAHAWALRHKSFLLRCNRVAKVLKKKWTKRNSGNFPQTTSLIRKNNGLRKSWNKRYRLWFGLKKNILVSFPRRLGKGRDCKEHPDICEKNVLMYQWRWVKGYKNPAKVLANIVKVVRLRWWRKCTARRGMTQIMENMK